MKKISLTVSDLKKAFDHFKIQTDVNEFVAYTKTNSFTKSATNSDDTAEFQELLMQKRRLLKHKVVTELEPTHAQYKQLQRVVSDANEFCEAFGLNKSVGYIHYIDFNLKLIKSHYSISSFIYNKENIFNTYSDFEYIKKHLHRNLATALADNYKRLYQQRCHLNIVIDPNNVVQYIHVVRTVDEIMQNKATISDWLEAQFDGLTYIGVVPELKQLWGGKSLERYMAFMSAKKLKDGIEQPIEHADKAMRDYLSKI